MADGTSLSLTRFGGLRHCAHRLPTHLPRRLIRLHLTSRSGLLRAYELFVSLEACTPTFGLRTQAGCGLVRSRGVAIGDGEEVRDEPRTASLDGPRTAHFTDQQVVLTSQEPSTHENDPGLLHASRTLTSLHGREVPLNRCASLEVLSAGVSV